MPTYSTPVTMTPLHHWHAANGAHFIPSGSWQIPAFYSAVEREVEAARNNLGVADISAFAKISLLGQGVPALAARLLDNGHSAQPRGVVPFDAGSRGLACRLTTDHLLLLTNATHAQELEDRLTKLQEADPIVQSNVTSAYAGFGLVGPQVETLLSRLTSMDVSPSALPQGSCAETSLAGVYALLVRPPELAISALQVYVTWDVGEYVWERLFDAGRPLNIRPIGLEAWRRLGS